MGDDYGVQEGLRERVIAIICEERPTPDNQLSSSAIHERLIRDGVSVSAQALHDVLGQLGRHDDIAIVLGSASRPNVGMTVRGVSSELCP